MADSPLFRADEEVWEPYDSACDEGCEKNCCTGHTLDVKSATALEEAYQKAEAEYLKSAPEEAEKEAEPDNVCIVCRVDLGSSGRQMCGRFQCDNHYCVVCGDDVSPLYTTLFCGETVCLKDSK